MAFSDLLPLILFFFSFIFLLKKLITLNHHKSTKPLPGPFQLPLIGSALQLRGDLLHRRLSHLAGKHGPLFLLRLGEVNYIIITSSELAMAIMKTHDTTFASRPVFLAGKIIFYNAVGIGSSPYGKYWSYLRKICTVDLLSTKRVESFGFIRSEEGNSLVKQIRAAGASPVNLKDMFLSLTNKTVARAAFGNDYGALQKKFLKAMKVAFKNFSMFFVADFYPSMSFVGAISGQRRRLEKLHRSLDEVLDEMIEEHRVRWAEGGGAGKEDIIDVLFRIKNSGESEICLTLENIKAVILELFLAGTETTASAMEWVMSELISHPIAMQKVQSEVRDIFNRKTQIEEKDITGKLPYLNQVIKETLRLHPVGPLLLPRYCSEETRVEGYTIPAKSRIVINAWAIMRDSNYWAEPESFKPERFAEAAYDFKASKFEYIPFGGGRRICPGITFAAVGMEYWLAQLLFHFDWQLINGMKPEELDMDEGFGLTVSRKNDLVLLATPYA